MQASLFQLIRAFLLFLLFSFYWLATGFFYHTHIDDNNRVVSHSHPFGSENHHHPNNNLVLIDKLSGYESSLWYAVEVKSDWRYLHSTYYICETETNVLLKFNYYSYSRPPPRILTTQTLISDYSQFS